MKMWMVYPDSSDALLSQRYRIFIGENQPEIEIPGVISIRHVGRGLGELFGRITLELNDSIIELHATGETAFILGTWPPS